MKILVRALLGVSLVAVTLWSPPAADSAPLHQTRILLICKGPALSASADFSVAVDGMHLTCDRAHPTTSLTIPLKVTYAEGTLFVQGPHSSKNCDVDVHQFPTDISCLHILGQGDVFYGADLVIVPLF